jgi:2-polyprenyl-3-methyl-5-hydroxy-6-metoxy-1,4-benzoquinol methylase
MKEAWDNRYKSNEYLYGYNPNEFISAEIKKIAPGSILLPGDGEGRNSVYAAKQGWKVTAFDYSSSGKQKALRLAKSENITINYDVLDVNNFDSTLKLDVVAISFLHLHADTRINFHKKLKKFLKPTGQVILECFSKSQLNNNTGGPKDLNLLYSIDELKNDFSDYNIESIDELETILNEGPLHQGKANVIRLIAKHI